MSSAMTGPQGVYVTEELHALVQQAAWASKGSASSLGREAIEAFVTTPESIHGWGDDPGNGKKRINLKVPEGLWESLGEAAWSQHLSLASAFRIAIRHRALAIIEESKSG